MNHFTDMLSDAVLSKKLEACSLEELQSFSEKHPYASALQLLYAKKLKEANDERYAKQLQQTLLYYKNPLLINHLIETDEQSTLNSTIKNERTSLTEDFSSEEDVTNLNVHSSPTDALLNIDLNQENKALNDEAPNTIQQIEKENTEQFFKPQIEADIVEESMETETIDDAEPLLDLPQFKIEAIDPAKAELSFTPYYTVDYFAAQGIKLGDQNANDRFGNQLKSFTDWLKHMKRLPGVNVKTNNITATEEKNIEKMAQHSLNGENANTEAMAEVWIKQGELKKAIDIYKKLSLQIPRKSAYFAAKIDHLKK